MLHYKMYFVRKDPKSNYIQWDTLPCLSISPTNLTLGFYHCVWELRKHQTKMYWIFKSKVALLSLLHLYISAKNFIFHQTITNNKHCLTFINRGRFGVVYRCVEKATGKDFAAKFIKTKPSDREAVRAEIRIMNELHHPKLLQCVDAYEVPKQIIMVMEL